MSQRCCLWGQISWGLTAALILVAQAMSQAGICFNLSPSMPVGIYKRHAVTPTIRVQRGDLVSFCPPRSLSFYSALNRHYLAPGSCAFGQVQPLLKPVVAVAGDIVCISQLGVQVNGRQLAHSQARALDSRGRLVQKMLQGTYKVQTGEVWLVSSHSDRSFDSRYFGPVPLSQLQWIVSPIITGD